MRDCKPNMASNQPAICASDSVVSVQELIKRPIDTVPERYVRLDVEPQILISDNQITQPDVPIIDMEKLSVDDATSMELEKLNAALEDWGFFQLVNHGVSASLLKEVKHEIEEFFKLPASEKMKYKRSPGEAEGYGNVVRSEGKLDWGDRFFMTVNPIFLRKSHLFPQLPTSLRETLESYVKEMQKLAMQIFSLISKCLNMEASEIKAMFDDGFQTLRMTYYPPCPHPELVVGLTPHSDAAGITILHQINGIDGLQIRKNGTWYPVHILPDAFIVNVGDILEILSNGLYNSIEHRAMVNSSTERISIAMFFSPKPDAEIGPIPALVSRESPALYKRMKMETYVKEFFSQKLHGKSYLERMKHEKGKAVAHVEEG